MWEKEKDFEILEELEHYDLEDEIGDRIDEQRIQ
jgi:hypothetical protein